MDIKFIAADTVNGVSVVAGTPCSLSDAYAQTFIDKGTAILSTRIDETSSAYPDLHKPGMAKPAAGSQPVSIDPASGDTVVSGIAYRGRTVARAKDIVAALAVSVRNPHAFASTNEPAAFHVKFKRGEVPSPGCMRVVDAAGNIIPWQFDPARHPYSDSPAGLYDDGSVRAGKVWILANFAANEVKTYSIQVAKVPFGDVFTPRVAFVNDSGSLKSFATATVKVQFDSARAWQFKNAFDIANANANLNATGNGMYHINQLSSGVTKISYTGADVTNTAGAELGNTSFGYGVVFREWEASFQYAAETSTTVRTRYRFFANNRMHIDTLWSCSAAQASQSRVQRTELTIKDATSVPTNRQFDAYISSTYGGTAKVLIGLMAFQSEYPSNTGQSHGTAYSNASSSLSMGWSSITDVPKGAFFRICHFASFLFDSVANELLRCHGTPQAVAAKADVQTLKTTIRSGLAELARSWEVIEGEDTNYMYAGSRVTAKLALARHDGTTPDVVQCQTLFEKWASNNGIDPSSASSYHTRWNVPNNVGLEFIGPNASCLYPLYKEAVRQGLTGNAATLASYIHAVADFIVLAEVTSGGNGKMLLKGSEIDNYNARGTGMQFLASSLTLTPNASRLDTLTRMATNFVGGYRYGHKLPYSLEDVGELPYMAMVVKYPRMAYHGYGMLQIAKADRWYPCLPSKFDYRVWALEWLSPLTVADEWKWNKQHNRRGLPSTQVACSYAMVLGQTPDAGDWQFVANVVEHLLGKVQSGRIVEKEIDGWLGTFDGTVSASWGGADSSGAAWHLLYELVTQ